MKTAAIIATAALAISACAQSPSAIAPVSMAGAFDELDCRRAGTMLSDTQTALAALESAQKSAVVGDAVGVFLIGVPMASLTGADKAGDIGAAKGRRDALQARLLSCGGAA